MMSIISSNYFCLKKVLMLLFILLFVSCGKETRAVDMNGNNAEQKESKDYVGNYERIAAHIISKDGDKYQAEVFGNNTLEFTEDSDEVGGFPSWKSVIRFIGNDKINLETGDWFYAEFKNSDMFSNLVSKSNDIRVYDIDIEQFENITNFFNDFVYDAVITDRYSYFSEDYCRIVVRAVPEEKEEEGTAKKIVIMSDFFDDLKLRDYVEAEKKAGELLGKKIRIKYDEDMNITNVQFIEQ